MISNTSTTLSTQDFSSQVSITDPRIKKEDILPKEILKQIFVSLPPEQLGYCRRVCASWACILDSSFFLALVKSVNYFFVLNGEEYFKEKIIGKFLFHFKNAVNFYSNEYAILPPLKKIQWFQTEMGQKDVQKAIEKLFLNKKKEIISENEMRLFQSGLPLGLLKVTKEDSALKWVNKNKSLFFYEASRQGNRKTLQFFTLFTEVSQKIWNQCFYHAAIHLHKDLAKWLVQNQQASIHQKIEGGMDLATYLISFNIKDSLNILMENGLEKNEVEKIKREIKEREARYSSFNKYRSFSFLTISPDR